MPYGRVQRSRRRPTQPRNSYRRTRARPIRRTYRVRRAPSRVVSLGAGRRIRIIQRRRR